MIGKPFDDTRIFQRCNTNRFPVIIDLRILIGHLKLGHDVHHASHLLITEKRCGIPVQQRNCGIIHLFDI